MHCGHAMHRREVDGFCNSGRASRIRFPSEVKGEQAEGVSRRIPPEILKKVRYAPICDDKDLRVGLAGPIWHYFLLSANSSRNGCG